jgi:hypothetical protein
MASQHGCYASASWAPPVHRCRFNCNVNALAVRGMPVGVDGACRWPDDLDEVAVGVA